jgi:PKD repeat protein
MRNMNGCKLATAVLVFTLLLSSIIIIPGTPVEGADSTYKISFNVTDTGTDPIVNAQATLEEVHTGDIVSTNTDGSGLAIFSPGPGYYALTITKTGFFDRVYDEIIRFDGISNKYLGQIQMETIPSMDYWFNITVQKTGTSDLVDDVTLVVMDTAKSQVIWEGMRQGEFNISVYAGNFKLIMTAPGYAKSVETQTISGNTSVTLDMDTSSLVRRYVYIDDAPVTSGLSAYLVSKNNASDIDERIIEPRSVSTNTFLIDAYDGDFWLLINANGAIASVSEITVNGSETNTTILQPDVNEAEDWTVDFGGDWNSFDLTLDFIYNFDRTHPAIDYSFLPNARMQVDFAFGNADGEVNQTEADDFVLKLKEFGPFYVNTIDFLSINDTAFLSDPAGFSSAAIDGIVGSVNSTSGYSGTMITPYTTIPGTSIDPDAPDYYADITVITGVEHVSDSPMDRVYNIVLRDGYQLVGNQTDDPDVIVMGYTTVTITPDVDMAWGTDDVSLEIEANEAPSAVAAIQTGPYAYAEMDNETLLYYIARVDKELTFTALGSFDPNGNPLTYTWDFGDLSGVTVSTITTKHTYTQKVFQLNVKLTVTDVTGETDEATFKVRVDGVDPVDMIKVDGVTIEEGGTVEADQNEPLVFDGSGSVDYINSTSDPENGIIVKWHWNFGDGNSTTVVIPENVTHAYADAGTFPVTLNVTDAVGHYTTETIYVDVKDTTPPVVQFVVLNSDFKDISEESPIENETLYFNGSKTHDSFYPQDELEFVWDFGDGANDTGINASHSYAAIGKFTAKLTVTDPAGNTANKTMVITVISSPRPDLRITSVTTEPSRFTEGATGSIMVNITNVGNDNATAIKATFYLVKTDGSKEKLGESTDLTVGGSPANLLLPDESGIITWSWTPGGKGNYTIYVEVTADREINKQDNHDTFSVDVQEAAWKAAAIYGGIFAVIVVIIVLFYMRKRLPWGASKAPARTRKSKK